MSETSCEESNLSHCKGVSSKAFDEAEEREYEVVNLRRAINIVAYLVMSVGMTGNIFNSFILPTFKLLFKLTSKELVYLIPVRLEFQNFFPKNASVLILFWRSPTFCTSYHITLNG